MEKIFIIDDDEMYQMVLRRTIGKINKGIEICSYWDGEEALNAVMNMFENNEKKPALVFLDINMPVLDGWQFLEELEKYKPDVREHLNIYMISTSLDSNDRQKALQNKNVKELLTKPLSIQTLKDLTCGGAM